MYCTVFYSLQVDHLSLPKDEASAATEGKDAKGDVAGKETTLVNDKPVENDKGKEAKNEGETQNHTGNANEKQEGSTVTGSEGEENVTLAELSLMRKALRRGIVECKNKVEVFQRDPNNPLYSVKTFEALNLRKELLEGIYDMGFKLPSKIQEMALPSLLADP